VTGTGPLRITATNRKTVKGLNVPVSGQFTLRIKLYPGRNTIQMQVRSANGMLSLPIRVVVSAPLKR